MKPLISLAFALLFFTTFLSLITPSTQNTPKNFVDAHNAARAEVGIGPVTWDKTVAKYAEDYAKQRQEDCVLEHSDGPYGENIFWGYGKNYTAADAVESWVSEKKDYRYNSNTCARGKVCGHYTQVVWANTKKIGCARVVCEGGAIFITCNYDPPGNYPGKRPYKRSALFELIKDV